MKIKKKKLMEIIDGDGELIGNENVPHAGDNLETAAKNTTDYNAKIGTQPFRYDMLGRFGFTLMPFMEGVEENGELNELINDLAKLMYDRYIEIIGYYYKNPNKLKSDFRLHSTRYNFDSQPEKLKKNDFEWAKKILKIVQNYIEKLSKEFDSNDKNSVVEDKVIRKKMEAEMSKKSEDLTIREKKLQKVAELISKLNKQDWEIIKKITEEGQ